VTEHRKPTFVQLVEMEQAARVAAGRYRNSVLGQDDRVQSAWVALLKAHRTYDPALGPFFPFCLRAAIIAVRKAHFEAKHPVSGGKHDPKVLAHVERVDVDEAAPVLACHKPTPDEELDRLRFAKRVRARTALVIGREALPFAMALAVGDFQPAEIAEYNGIPRAQVYKLRAQVRRALRDDTELFRMHKESRR
jgi:DNA-directed RNA polymerase specialized sigma24 family protein